MTSSVFIIDTDGTPLMPAAPAYARWLLQQQKAEREPHHAFTILRLKQRIATPTLRPVLLRIAIDLRSAEFRVIAAGERRSYPLLHITIDLRTDLPWRLRRRAGHRRRRRARSRYRAPRRFGVRYALRRPSLFKSGRKGSAASQRQRGRSGQGAGRGSMTMQWRTEMLLRVYNALRRFIPISHAVVLAPRLPPRVLAHRLTAHQRREVLIELYGTLAPAGTWQGACAYCGRMATPLVVDHVIPESRGGTTRWSNLVIACTPCNQRKRDQTPKEAGMALAVDRLGDGDSAQRSLPYRFWTARLLSERLSEQGLLVQCNPSIGAWADPVLESLTTLTGDDTLFRNVSRLVARPVARPPKQQFTGRIYPQTALGNAGFVKVGTAVRRRVTVNAALHRQVQHHRAQITVIPTGERVPTTGQVIRRGMLCGCERARRWVIGVVVAIRSDGRLTLAIPSTVDRSGVTWSRVIVSPKKRFAVLSTDRVVFLSWRNDDRRTETTQ